MNLGEFIRKLLRNYMPESTSQSRIEEIFNDYYKELSACGNCDYDKAYSEIFRTYDKARMPNAAYLIEILSKYKATFGNADIVQIINFKIMQNGIKKEFAFSTADCSYESLKRKWEKLGWYVVTDKYGNDVGIKDVHYAK